MTNPTPVIDANGDPVIAPAELADDPTFRLFMSGRVPAECGHGLDVLRAVTR